MWLKVVCRWVALNEWPPRRLDALAAQHTIITALGGDAPVMLDAWITELTQATRQIAAHR